MIMPQFFGVGMNEFKCVAEKIIKYQFFWKWIEWIKDIYIVLVLCNKKGNERHLYKMDLFLEIWWLLNQFKILHTLVNALITCDQIKH